MIFTAPRPFKEALNAQAVKTLLPTSGRTADLSRLESDIKRRALFSATVQSVAHLQKLDDVINGILTGQLDHASARLALKDLLAEQGYVPDPEDAGGLKDLSSDRRINLQLETNVDTARGYGWREQGMQADVLDEWPAQELYRAFGPSDASKQRDWAARWAEVGGQFFGGRMIALKTDPVWERLGDPGKFPDGLGNPYPPFAFNSGMDVRDIDRAEAEDLGLIDASTELFPQPLDLNADLAASPDVRAGWLKDALTETGLGQFDSKGVYHFRGEDAA